MQQSHDISELFQYTNSETRKLYVLVYNAKHTSLSGPNTLKN